MSGMVGVEVVLPNFAEPWREKAGFGEAVSELLGKLTPYQEGVSVRDYLNNPLPVRYLAVQLDVSRHGHTIGIGTLWPHMKQGFGEVHDLVVDPKSHHLAIGSQIMKRIIAMAQALDLQHLKAAVKVKPGREAAHRLFLRHGFVELGRTEVSGERAIVYQLSLRAPKQPGLH